VLEESILIISINAVDADADTDADVTHISVNVYCFRKLFKYIVGNDADGVALLHLIDDDDKLIPT